jgi:hypothetical protein
VQSSRLRAATALRFTKSCRGRQDCSVPSEIVFVYNADGTIAGKVKDVLHKIIRPDTYPCKLCEITYGIAGMKREWREFVASLGRRGITVEFLHRDELRSEHASLAGSELPAAWHRAPGDDAWTTTIDAATMRACDSLHDLIGLVRAQFPTDAP